MNPYWCVRTGRTRMTPVAYGDLPDLRALKADPLVFGLMLGGVRTPRQSAEELALDGAYWARNGYGMWTVRSADASAFLGTTGFSDRPDGRGVALRFAFREAAQGRGLAREAAAAALRFGHEQGALPCIVAVARETNFASRTLLGAIGMVPAETFEQQGHAMILFESRLR